MTKRKLHFYKITNTSDLLITPWEDFSISYKGKRKETFWYKKIVLELACGKGEYTIGLAQHFPDTLFIGIDIKWDRFSRGIQKANELWLHNVRFIRWIIQHLDRRFAENEIDEIRIVHPDPRPRHSDRWRRLTNKRFIDIYDSLLVPDGKVRLKTDDKPLFDYSLESFQEEKWNCIAETYDLHNSPLLDDHFSIVTDYEKKAIDEWRSIAYAVWNKDS